MQPQACPGVSDPEWTAYVYERAAFHAGRLIKRFNLSSSDHEDLLQEMALAARLAMRRFDPRRASWKTFVSMVVESHARVIARQLRRARPRQVELQEWHARSSGGNRADEKIDLEIVVRKLPDGHRALAAGLTELTVQELSVRLGLNRTSAYRVVAQIRAAPTVASLCERRDKPPGVRR